VKWEREQVGKESGERRGGYLRCGKWECRKNSPKTQKIWHLGTPLEAKAIAPCHTFLDSSFQGQYFRRSLCHYLEPFKSNRASNLTILQKSPLKFSVFGIIADTPRVTAPCHTSLERSFHAQQCLADSMPLSCIPFRSYKASKMTIL